MSSSVPLSSRMLRRLLWLALACAAAAAITGCGSVVDPPETVVFQVAEVRVPCMAVAPMECYLLLGDNGAEWQLFYDAIEGFTFEWGYRYVLQVRRTTVRNPPADGSSYSYRLEQVLSVEESPRRELVARVRAAEQRWHELRPATYVMVQERLCYCLPEARGPVRMEVTRLQGGDPAPLEWISSLRYVANDSVVQAPYYHGFHTVWRLFQPLYVAVARADSVTVEFDAALGYPRSVFIDWSAGLADDEVHYLVHSLTG
jgi:hypothetical protein